MGGGICRVEDPGSGAAAECAANCDRGDEQRAAHRFDGCARCVEGSLLLASTGTNTMTFSLFSISATLGTASRQAGPLANRWLQTVFIAYCVLFPLAWHGLVAALWLYRPAESRKTARLLRVAEVLHAWSFLEVFLVVLFLITPRLEEQESHTLGEEFIAADRILGRYAEQVALPGGAAGHHVIALQGVTLGGFWLLTAAILVANAVGLLMMHVLNVSLGRAEEVPCSKPARESESS